MHDLFAFLNSAGDHVLDLARPMFLQSSLLILVLIVGDRILRHRIRPVLRHSLWLLVPIKLLLPPTLALPTSPSYWLPRFEIHTAPPPNSALAPSIPGFLIRYFEHNPETDASIGTATVPARIDRPEDMPKRSGLLLATWILGALVLFGRTAIRTGSLRKLKLQATLAPEPVHRETDTIRAQIGLRRPVPLLLHDGIQTPALCGLSSPVMLLPRSLLRTLSAPQLKSVLLHELIHARRGDLWINATQTFLQIVWWWHPLLWLANSRLRTTREEAVDDEVAHHLGPEAGDYPLALLEVARHALRRPVLSLGLIGIIETRSALRSRIERLLERPAHGSPRMGISALLAVLVAGLVLLPMARGGASKAPIRSETALSEAVLDKSLSEGPAIINPTARSRESNGTASDLREFGRFTASAPNAFFIRFPQDIGMVHGKPEPVASDQRFLDQSNRSLLIEAFAFLLPVDEARSFGLGRAIGLPPNSHPSTNRFSATELRGFVSALKNRPDVEAIARPRIVTLPGRGAEITFTNSSISSAPTLSFRVQPELAADGQGLQLDCKASVTQILSLTSGSQNQPIAEASEAASDSTPFTVHALGYVTQHLTNTVLISDGEGFLMTTPSPDTGPLSVRRPVIYVKATWGDPAVDRR